MSLREEYLDSAEETLLIQQQSLQSRIWTALPAIVISVDYERFTLSVQPAIQGRIEDENGETTFVDLPVLEDVPLLLPNAGGWHLTFPVKPDDECLLVFSSRCVDAWWQSGGVQKPMTTRMHDLSDAFALLAPYSQKLAPECKGGYSGTSVILRDDQKQNFIEFTNDGKLNILHQADLDSDTLGSADIYIKGDAHVKIDGSLTSEVTKDAHIQIGGNLVSEVTGNTSLKTGGNLTSEVTKDAHIQIGGNLTSGVAGDAQVQVSGNLASEVAKDAQVKIGGNLTSEVTGNETATVTGNLNATVGGDIAAKASNISLTCSSLTVNAPTSTFTGSVSVAGSVSAASGAFSGSVAAAGGSFAGSVKAGGTVTASNCIGGGISLSGHVHGGVKGGPDVTGGPI